MRRVGLAVIHLGRIMTGVSLFNLYWSGMRMFRVVSRVLALGILPIAISAGLQAQTTDLNDSDHDHAGGIVCGSLLVNDGRDKEVLERTARNNPEFYRMLVERSKNPKSNRAMLGVGDTYTFSVRNMATFEFDAVEAVQVFAGKWARIWVDVRDTSRSAVMTKIGAIARGLDSATGSTSRNPGKGIIENDQEVFGLPPVNQADPSSPVQDFLLTDIQDGMTGGGFVGGFFSPLDQTPEAGSNNMNILYIDSRQGVSAGTNAMLSTVAHEFQHLIHYRTNEDSDILYNEGCSEVASILLGYKDRTNSSYMKSTNVPMFTWNYNNSTKLLADYERAMTLLYYLYEQYGEQFLTAFASTKSERIDRITDALNAIGRNPDWQGTLTAYAVANYIGKNFTDDRFIYRMRLSSTTPTATYAYTGSGAIPATGSVSVQSYASTYTTYTNPGLLKVKFKASRPYGVMAILYQGTTPVEVKEIANDTEYRLAVSGNTPYDKVVFAIANHAQSAQTVSWTVEQLAAGVENTLADVSSFGVESIAPNPAVGSARVTFRNAQSGSVNVELYNPKGELVRTLVDNQRYEAGQHEVMVNTADLPSGVYMVRVLQDGQASSRVMVVLNK